MNGYVAKASRKTDTYAFVIVSWEILTQKKPFCHIKNELDLGIALHQGIRPSVADLPNETPPGIIEMIKSGWSLERCQRKTAAECYSILNHNLSVISSSEFDIFFSHAWASKPFLSNVYSELTKFKYRVWYDQNDMGLEIKDSMITGIKNSRIVIACVDSRYQEREN
jgi:hypothetical protein